MSGCFIGAVALAAFPLAIHEIQKVTGRPRIAERTVMRLEFDPVKLAQFPEAVRLVSGVAPTHAGDGAQLRKPEAAIESYDLTGTPIQVLQETITYFRPRLKGTLIANFGFDKTSANIVLAAKQAELVSFGNAFIGNPDLVRRMRDDIALSTSNRDLYYQGGAEGYTDYPPAA